MDNQPVQPPISEQPNQQPIVNQPSQERPSHSKKAPVLIVLLLLLFAAAIYGTYYWQHKKTAQLQSQVSNLQSQVNKLSQTSKEPSSTTKSTPPSQTQYLKISEFGIELPLTSAISDLTYTPPPVINGQTQPIAYLNSATQLAKQIQAIDPACPGGSYSLPGGEYITTDDPTASNHSILATVTVSGKTYYLTHKGASGGCDPNATTAQATQIDSINTAYANEVMNAFKNAKAL